MAKENFCVWFLLELSVSEGRWISHGEGTENGAALNNLVYLLSGLLLFLFASHSLCKSACSAFPHTRCRQPTGHRSSGTEDKWWSHSKFPVGRELSVLILFNCPLWVHGYVIPTWLQGPTGVNEQHILWNRAIGWPENLSSFPAKSCSMVAIGRMPGAPVLTVHLG